MPGALNMPDAGAEQKTRVILVEDEGFFRDMLRVSLTQSGRVEVVGDFADGESALAAAPDLEPRVALLDIELRGGMHGIQASRHFIEDRGEPGQCDLRPTGCRAE